MTAPTPAEAFAAAIRKLRPHGQTAEPIVTVQLAPAAVEGIAVLMDALAEWDRAYPDMAHDPDPVCDNHACDVIRSGIELARLLAA